jgi:hypothetical protein
MIRQRVAEMIWPVPVLSSPETRMRGKPKVGAQPQFIRGPMRPSSAQVVDSANGLAC